MTRFFTCVFSLPDLNNQIQILDRGRFSICEAEVSAQNKLKFVLKSCGVNLCNVLNIKLCLLGHSMRDPHRTASVMARRNSPDDGRRESGHGLSSADRDRLSAADARKGSFKLLLPSPRPSHRALSPSPRST